MESQDITILFINSYILFVSIFLLKAHLHGTTAWLTQFSFWSIKTTADATILVHQFMMKCDILSTYARIRIWGRLYKTLKLITFLITIL